MPCSGRTLPVPHSGPPMAPRRTAEAALAASRASSVRGVPWALMEHWRAPQLLVGGSAKRRGDLRIRTYTAHQMLLDVETPGRRAVCLNGLEHLHHISVSGPLFAPGSMVGASRSP